MRPPPPGSPVLLLATLAIFATFASPVRAGTPLPAAFGGGFVPPVITYAKGADGSLKSFATYANFISKCYRRATRDVFGGVPDLLAGCLFEGQVKFQNQAISREQRGWLPGCLAGANTTALLSAIDGFLLSGTPAQIWCEGSVSLPPVFGGGLVPSNPLFLNGENHVHALLAGYWKSATACYRKGAKRAAVGASDQTPACLDRARSRLDSRLASVGQAGQAPACLGTVEQQALADSWDGFIRDLNPLVFCASPSGAFLDGAGGF